MTPEMTREQQRGRYFSSNMETREDALQRLRKNKNVRDDVKKLREEIYFKTGNEFSFKMHSLRSQNGKLVEIEKQNAALQKSKIVQIDFEILRIEKKLKKMTPIYKSRKIIFGKENTHKSVKSSPELKSNSKKVLVYEEYLRKLHKKRRDLVE